MTASTTQKPRYRVNQIVETVTGRCFSILSVIPASKSPSRETSYRVVICAENGDSYGPAKTFPESHIARRLRNL
jgi:hypothetical protein